MTRTEATLLATLIVVSLACVACYGEDDILLGEKEATCNAQDSARMILQRSKFWGTHQINGEWISHRKIRPVLREAEYREPYLLLRKGYIFEFCIGHAIAVSSIALLFTPIPRYVSSTVLCGGFAFMFAGEYMRERAIEKYNENICAPSQAAVGSPGLIVLRF